MQSCENIPVSLSKRPSASLNIDTGYKSKTKVSSPPRTPKKTASRIGNGNNAVPGRALKIRTGPRETFLDDITPIDVAAREYGRDSHDLSLSPRQVTRDSLVDHMLHSLDQISFGQGGAAPRTPQPSYDEAQLYSSFGDEDAYPLYNTPQNVRRPGHGHSHSSDYEGHDLTRRPSSQLTRGRRSNSSSNIQTSLSRVNSIQMNGSSNGTAVRPPQVQPRVLHSRSGKGSKSSSANSFDLGYAQVTGTQRWAHGMAGRSSSFDLGRDRQALNRQINTPASPFSPYDYDAAPTPTVPVGPRRHIPLSPNIPFQPETMPPPPIPKIIERKRSTKSSKSVYKGSGDNANALGINFSFGKVENRELPPLPVFVKEAAPSPLVGYNKSKESGQGDRTQAQAPPAKDRPGFFRRVFGSSKNNHPPPEASFPYGSTTSVEIVERPSSKPQHVSSQLKSKNLPATREPSSAPKENHHTLTKKPSSFFRRRKKSISEPLEAPPPPPPPRVTAPPLQTHHNREDLRLDLAPSPVSSLRKVMNPYLNSLVRSPQESRKFHQSQLQDNLDIEADDLKGFSPGYEPDKSATIRTVKPESRDCGGGETGASHTDLDLGHLDSRGLQVPSGSSNRTEDQRDGTFLQDSSDNDREEKNAERLSTVNKGASERRVASPLPPASVARDMALVAEYERIHSKRSPGVLKEERAASHDSLRGQVGSKPNNVKCPEPISEGEWAILTPGNPALDKDHRVWLEPSSSEEELAPKSNISLPLEGARASTHTSGSTSTAYKSATSLAIPTVEVDDEHTSGSRLKPMSETGKPIDEREKTTSDAYDPTEEDKDRAKKIYDGNEAFIMKAKAAAWLGEDGQLRRRTLIAYMELYDFANLNILAALRLLCGRLVLKGESQQVDRILDEFSKRWCKCNPNHGFKTADVVHTICYSLLLLNTDLYLADIDAKMTRSQFVKNTLPTILRVVADSAPGAFESTRPSILQRSCGGEKDLLSPTFKPNDDGLDKEIRTSTDNDRPSWRVSIKPPTRTDSDGRSPTPLNYNTPQDECGPLVRAPFHGTLRTWEVQVEIVLKDFYNSIKVDRLPLFGAPIEKQQPSQQSSTLSVFSSGMLRRSPSVLSKAPSEPQSYSRGRTADTVRLGTGKWASKNRSRPRVYPSSAVDSSRTSLDDQSSMWSPSVSSSTWSKYSLGKTQTSMSVDSMRSNWPHADYQQSIGFANALSQAIIREETIGSGGSNYSDELKVAPLLEDESLELAGAPWAKEGIVKHKHHLEAVDKKAKDRNWNEVFAVIEKGYMSLFSFSSKSLRNKSRLKAVGGVVGGGNWQDNAENLGSFLLRQTIASALPPPGYSKARPHVWALSLPTGAVHLFQVGTPEIVREFVSTANYWSARLSNHPLVGGISNIEYGWSDAIVNNPLVIAINDTTRPSTSGHRTSLQSSLRSSFDQGTGGYRSKLPGDRVMIADWTPPTQSMRASNLMERDQLQSLLTYVKGIEGELQKHNLLRSSMLLAVSLHSPNISTMS
jgi:Sec7 domain/Pleckstrin homology domain